MIIILLLMLKIILSQLLKDWVLALAVAVMISVDLIILVTYTILELVGGNFTVILKSNDENFTSRFGVSNKA